MAKDLTPTAVVRRPVDEAPQTILYGRRTKKVGFDCERLTHVKSGCKAIVAQAGDGTVTLYAELPNVTLKLIYGGLDTIYVKATEEVKEGAIIALGKGTITLEMVRLPDNTHVEPEFFYPEDIVVPLVDEKPKQDDYPHGFY